MTESDDDILHEARERFRHAQSWESQARVNYRDDVRFGNGDNINNWQWPQEIANTRSQQQKPTLTVNLVRQHCLNILNDQRQNKPQIEIRAVGGGASFKSAEIFESVCRHIEYQSNAQDAYDAACLGQVYGGIGWFRITTDWADSTSFDQQIFIKRVPDSLSVYLDSHITEFDGSDARWGFVFRDLPRDEFEAEFPDEKDLVNTSPLGELRSQTSDYYDWYGTDRVRVAEYYRRIDADDRLHHMPNGETIKESDVKAKNPDLLKTVRAASVRSRAITTPKIEHFLIAGLTILERNDWAGRYIPLVRVVGEETVIDGQLDRKGHVRAIVSSQQCYNYYTSAGIEFVALQSKTPYVAPVAAIEGYESEWAQANVVNLAILPYNHMDDTGKEIPPPSREQPPVFAPAYLDGTKLAAQEIQSASGQTEATFGQPSNERSGKAVDARQRIAATSTYHYLNNFANAIRFAGKILIDLIPKIYDTQRIMKILAEDGTETTVQIDPQAPQAHQPAPALDPEALDPQAVSAIFNPTIGEYSVVAEIGPSYMTRRQETFNAISQMIMADAAIAPIVGDLLFRNSDFVGSDVIADRLKNMVPDKALGKGPDPQVVQLQQMLAQQHQVMAQMGQELEVAKSKQGAADQQKTIDWYEAETRRLAAVGKIDQAALMPVVRELVSQILGQPANPVIAQHVLENSLMQNAAAQQAASPQPQPGAPPAGPQPPAGQPLQ